MKDRTKYLTRDRFEEFRGNEFAHLVKDVSFLKGQLWIVLPVVLAILAAVVGLFLKR